MNIKTSTATLIAGILAFCGIIVSQWHLGILEDKRGRTEIVLEMMRADDQQGVIEKLRILEASGLMEGGSAELIEAISLAPPAAFGTVRVPTPVPCIEADQISDEVPPIGEKLSDDRDEAVRQLAANALKLRAQNKELRAVLTACAR